jgi:SAM-dependent methyltransferase
MWEIDAAKLGLDPATAQALARGRYAQILREELAAQSPRLAPRFWRWGLTGILRGRQCVELMRARVPVAGAEVLDFGSGDGGFSAAFAEAGANVTALDLDPARLRRAQALFQDFKLNVRAVIEPDYGDSLPAQSFDIIICTDVIEHVDSFPRLARSHARLLRPGGRLYVSVPNRFSIPNLISDPHFSLAGVSTLGRGLGEWYVVSLRRRAANYHVNRLLGWGEAHRLYRDAGIELECVSEQEFRRRLQSGAYSSPAKRMAARLLPAALAVPVHRLAYAISWTFIGAIK